VIGGEHNAAGLSGEEVGESGTMMIGVDSLIGWSFSAMARIKIEPYEKILCPQKNVRRG